MASLSTTVEIAPIAAEFIGGYWRAVDTVARERRYLTLPEAFPLPETRKFVLRLMDKGEPMFVALANGEVVGWCDIQRDPFPAHAHRGTLGIGVIPDCRGRGVGSRLVDGALKQAFANSFVRVEFSVRADNSHAMRLYEKFGFVRKGVVRDAIFVDGEYHGAIAMALVGRVRSSR